jgi:leucyl-tRNA synthetase
VYYDALDTVIKLLSPFAPQSAQDAWSHLHHTNVFDQPWCHVDNQALYSTTQPCVVMVNGKVRGTLTVASDVDQDALIHQVEQSPIALKWLTDKSTGSPLRRRKVIVAARAQGGQVVNFVLE